MRVIRCVRTSMGSNLIRLCVSELRSGMQIPIGGFCTRFCNLFCYFLRFFYLFGFHLTVAARRRFIKQASWVTDFAQFINTNYAAYALSFILFFFCVRCVRCVRLKTLTLIDYLGGATFVAFLHACPAHSPSRSALVALSPSFGSHIHMRVNCCQGCFI